MTQTATKLPKRTPRIGPRSGLSKIAKLDGRYREAQLMRDTVESLTHHVGGNPNAVQTRLIERVAFLGLRIAIMDAASPDGVMSEADTARYLAWVNTYSRTLAILGIKAARSNGPALADYIAGRGAPASDAPRRRGRPAKPRYDDPPEHPFDRVGTAA